MIIIKILFITDIMMIMDIGTIIPMIGDILCTGIMVVFTTINLK